MTEQFLVLDHGSLNIRCGWNTDTKPEHTINSIIYNDTEKKEPIFPIQHGIVQNWDQVESLWENLFSQYQKTDETCILFSEELLNPKEYKAKKLQILFEKFEFAAANCEYTSALNMYAIGNGNALVLDIGHGKTTTAGYFSNYLIPATVKRQQIGGDDVIKYVLNKLRVSYDVAMDIFETKCSASTEAPTPVDYKLPDGNIIQIPETIQTLPGECMFSYNELGRELIGNIELAVEAWNAAGYGARSRLAGRVILAGGVSQIPNYGVRAEQLLKDYLPAHLHVKTIVVEPDSAWKGGAIISGLSTFQQLFIGKEYYEETGRTEVLSAW
jgi:actin-related protein